MGQRYAQKSANPSRPPRNAIAVRSARSGTAEGRRVPRLTPSGYERFDLSASPRPGHRSSTENKFAAEAAALAMSRCTPRSQPKASKQLRDRRGGGLCAPFEAIGRNGVVVRQYFERAPGIRQRGLVCHLQALMLEVSKLLEFGHCESSNQVPYSRTQCARGLVKVWQDCCERPTDLVGVLLDA
jgi:hypothetical protein